MVAARSPAVLERGVTLCQSRGRTLQYRFSPGPAANPTGTLLTPFLARRLSVRTVIMIGLVVLIGGFVAANFLETATTMLVFAIASMLLGMGVGLAEAATQFSHRLRLR